ncbi:MAG: ArsR/SmtB family transcription factor [Haloarculaceae archaeon]
MTHLSADAGARFSRRSRRSNEIEVPDDELLETLVDPTARTILAALGSAKTARELCEEEELPSSTVYRKLDQLVEAGLIEESTRVSLDGKHASEYRRRFEDVMLHVSEDDGFEVVVVNDDDPSDRLANLWSAVADQ